MILLTDIKPRQYLWLIPFFALMVGLLALENALGVLPETGLLAEFRWLISGPVNAVVAVFLLVGATKLFGRITRRGRKSSAP
jgi:hypothetical protein